jgi:hypothetical protein
MSNAKNLMMGIDCPSVTREEEVKRIEVLKATVEKYFPEFATRVKQASVEPKKDRTVMGLHQDAFAAGYDDDEYTLCGMCIKYAGLHDVHIMVAGKNHETFPYEGE